MSIFIGAGVALVTPFNEQGVDFDTLAKLIDFQINNGTDALIICGTTGEPPTMTKEEKREVIQFSIKHANKRIPIIVGTGGNCTRSAIEDSIAAQELGADALLVVTPYYNKCTQDGLIAHFTAIADAVSLPIIMYNVPSRTNVTILPTTAAVLAKHPNIVAIKDATGDMALAVETVRLCPTLDLYSGNDDTVYPLLALGAKGVISVLSNIAPAQTHELVAAFHTGDQKRSLELQLMLNPLVHAIFTEVNPIPVKYGVNLLGFNAGLPRLPLTELSEKNKAVLSAEMQKIGLLPAQQRS